MKTKNRKIKTSIFFIFLFITLPFYSSVAIAQTMYPSGAISSFSIKGSDNIQQVTKLGEQGIFFEVSLRTTAQASQVLINGVTMDSCTGGNSSTVCTLTLPNAEEGQRFYEARFGSQSQSLPVVTDGKSPEINSFSLNRLTDGRIQASFNAVDSARNTQLCAGISKIQISDNSDFSNIIAEETYSPQSLNDCLVQDTITFSGPSDSGQYTYFARAIDRVNHISDIEERLFGVDTDAPIISTPKIMKNGQEVTAFGIGTRSYELEVDISEEGDLVDVGADLTNLGGQADEEGDCFREGIIFHCSWDINPTIQNGTTSLAVEISAEDNDANINVQSFSVPVSVDTDAPSIMSIHTNNGNFIGGASVNTSIIAEISDAGGINEDAVVADLSEISSGYSSEELADECIDGKCYWNKIIATFDGDVEVEVYAEDVFGHSSTASETLTIDNIAPSFSSIVLMPNSPAYPDDLEIKISASDNANGSGLRNIVADATVISRESNIIDAPCSANECIITVEDLSLSPVNENVSFTIYDNAGNYIVGSRLIQIYETEANYTGDSVSVRIGEISPKLIDRKTASQIPFKVFVPVSYNKPQDIIVRDKSLQCDGVSEFLDLSVTVNPYFIGESLDSNLLVFVLGLDSVTVKTDFIKFNCTITMYLQQGTTVFENPEVDEFELKFGLYNNPQGTIDDAIVKKLKKIEKEVNHGWKGVLGDINKIFEIIRKICDIIRSVTQAYTFIEDMKPIVYTVTRLFRAQGGDAVWKAYLTMECYFKAFKDWLWPNDIDYAFTGEVNGEPVGVLAPLIGGVWKGTGEQPMIGGWVRKICAFTLCNQCSQGFNLIDAFIPPEESAGGEGGERAYSSAAEFIHDPLRPIPVLGDILSGAPRRSPTESEADYERRRRSTTDSFSLFKEVNIEAHYNPEDSFLVAVGCLCIPGLIANIEKYRQLQCIHAKCISDAASAGFSTADCDVAHQVRTCVWWTGALFNAFPPYALLKQITKVINDIIRELPGRLLDAFIQKGCRSFDETVSKQTGALGSVGPGFGKCSVKVEEEFLAPNPRTFVCGMLDAVMLGASWESYIENTFNFDSWEALFGDDKEVDYCEDAFDAIKEEKDDSGDNGSPTSIPLGAGI